MSGTATRMSWLALHKRVLTRTAKINPKVQHSLSTRRFGGACSGPLRHSMRPAAAGDEMHGLLLDRSRRAPALRRNGTVTHASAGGPRVVAKS